MQTKSFRIFFGFLLFAYAYLHDKNPKTLKLRHDPLKSNI